MTQPPDDAEVWSDEQWIQWLGESADDEPTEQRVYAPKLSSPAGTVIGAAMLGMQRAMFGDVEKPEVVIEVDANGKDDGNRVDLDPDDPSHSTVVVAMPRHDDDR